MQPSITINRIHHISLASRQAERTARFYVELLGLHLTDEAVTDGGRGSHVYSLSDGNGAVITITEVVHGAEGELGIGTVHHAALTVSSADALLKWKRWLQHNNILVYGPYDQQAYQDIIFSDPDGVMLELATDGPGWKVTENTDDVYSPPIETMAPYRDEEKIRLHTWPHPVTSIEPEMALRGFHHIATIVSALLETDHFYRGVLGLPLIRKCLDHDDPEVEQWYWGVGGGRPGSIITGFPIMHEQEGGKPVYGRAGYGVIDHFAMEVGADVVSLRNWGAGALSQEVEVTSLPVGQSPSISIRSPDGQIVDLVPAGADFMFAASESHGGGPLDALRRSYVP